MLVKFGPTGRGSDDDVTRPFSLAYKQKMLDRLTGKDAVSARQLSLETGLRQQTLSRWLQDACSLSVMPPKRPTRDVVHRREDSDPGQGRPTHGSRAH